MKLRKKEKQYRVYKGRKGLINKTPSFAFFGPHSHSNNHGPEQKSQSTGNWWLKCLRELGDPRGKRGR